MRIASHDRAEVLNLAGTSHLSPAVRDGAPCLVPEGETAGRVGWEAFFAALDRAGLVVAWDTEDPSSAAPVPGAEGRALERHPGLGPSLERTRRFVAVFRGRPAPPPAQG